MRISKFESVKSRGAVDVNRGIISGVSIVTKGEAATHGMMIDDTTLSQVLDSAMTYPGGLKVKMNHRSGVDAVIGTLQNLKIEGPSLRGDLHILDSAEQRNKLLEMANKMPEAFGLSIAFRNSPVEIDKVQYARCSEIFSADLVDDPAANPTGLFSKFFREPQPKNKIMTLDNKTLAKALGLAENATDEQVSEAFINRLTAKPEAAIPEAFEKKLNDALGIVTNLQKAGENATALSQKAEIESLLAEASRDGKKVPFENTELFEVKDGLVTIKMQPALLRSVISRLEKGAVPIKTRTATTAPADKDGKTLKGEELIAFCKQKQAEGAAQLNQFFAGQTRL